MKKFCFAAMCLLLSACNPPPQYYHTRLLGVEVVEAKDAPEPYPSLAHEPGKDRLLQVTFSIDENLAEYLRILGAREMCYGAGIENDGSGYGLPVNTFETMYRTPDNCSPFLVYWNGIPVRQALAQDADFQAALAEKARRHDKYMEYEVYIPIKVLNKHGSQRTYDLTKERYDIGFDISSLELLLELEQEHKLGHALIGYRYNNMVIPYSRIAAAIARHEKAQAVSSQDIPF